MRYFFELENAENEYIKKHKIINKKTNQLQNFNKFKSSTQTDNSFADKDNGNATKIFDKG